MIMLIHNCYKVRMKGLNEMNRKLFDNLLSRNICFGILTIIAMIKFVIQISNPLFNLSHGFVLNNVQYTIFEMKISETMGTYTHEYNIFYYPLIPILVGMIYNIYIIIKCHRNEDDVNS